MALDFKDRQGKWVIHWCWKGDRKTKHTMIGQKHSDMKKRCTDNSPEQNRHRRYIGCYISEGFKDINFFADWISKQYGFDLNWQLDKDLLIKDNMLYSENTCILLPNCLNKFLTKRQVSRGDLPIGVSWKVKNNAYCAAFTAEGKSTHIGLFDNSVDAFAAYKIAKEREAKRLANKWQSQIDPRAYNALMNYIVEITD